MMWMNVVRVLQHRGSAIIVDERRRVWSFSFANDMQPQIQQIGNLGEVDYINLTSATTTRQLMRLQEALEGL